MPSRTTRDSWATATAPPDCATAEAASTGMFATRVGQLGHDLVGDGGPSVAAQRPERADADAGVLVPRAADEELDHAARIESGRRRVGRRQRLGGVEAHDRMLVLQRAEEGGAGGRRAQLAQREDHAPPQLIVVGLRQRDQLPGRAEGAEPPRLDGRRAHQHLRVLGDREVGGVGQDAREEVGGRRAADPGQRGDDFTRGLERGGRHGGEASRERRDRRRVAEQPERKGHGGVDRRILVLQHRDQQRGAAQVPDPADRQRGHAPHHRLWREGAGLEGAGGELPRVLRLQERGERLHHRGALRGERRRCRRGARPGRPRACRGHGAHRAHAGSGMAWSSAATPAGSRVGSNWWLRLSMRVSAVTSRVPLSACVRR